MYWFFFSYAHADDTRAAQFYKALEDEGRC
jgi:hypothetical protein